MGHRYATRVLLGSRGVSRIARAELALVGLVLVLVWSIAAGPVFARYHKRGAQLSETGKQITDLTVISDTPTAAG
jgi:hypothetical protein